MRMGDILDFVSLDRTLLYLLVDVMGLFGDLGLQDLLVDNRVNVLLDLTMDMLLDSNGQFLLLTFPTQKLAASFDVRSRTDIA